VPVSGLLLLEEQLAPGEPKQCMVLGISPRAQVTPKTGCNRAPALGEQRGWGSGRLFFRSGFSVSEPGNFIGQGKQLGFGCMDKFM